LQKGWKTPACVLKSLKQANIKGGGPKSGQVQDWPRVPYSKKKKKKKEKTAEHEGMVRKETFAGNCNYWGESEILTNCRAESIKG